MDFDYDSLQLQAKLLNLAALKLLVQVEAMSPRRQKSELEEKALRREREDFDEIMITLTGMRASGSSTTSDSVNRGTKRRLTTEEEEEEEEQEEENDDNVCSPSKKQRIKVSEEDEGE